MNVIDSTPEFVSGVYARVADRLAEARRRLGRPMTFAEKVILSHRQVVEEERASLGVLFLNQFRSLVVYALVIAAVFTAAFADWVDFSIIVLLLLANAFIGFFQEVRAEAPLAPAGRRKRRPPDRSSISVSSRYRAFSVGQKVESWDRYSPMASIHCCTSSSTRGTAVVMPVGRGRSAGRTPPRAA